MDNGLQQDNSSIIKKVLLFFSCAFIIGGVIAGFIYKDLGNMIPGLIRIWTYPSQFTMDYFELGGLAATFLNCGIVGLEVVVLMYLTKTNANGVSVAAYWLNVGFAPFGMTALNCLPFFLGGYIYSKVKKIEFGKCLNFAFFSSALAPFVSELLFRYPLSGDINKSILDGVINANYVPHFTVLGLVGALALGIVVAFMMPGICGHAPNFHKGYDLYNAGPAAGFMAMLMFSLLYTATGVPNTTNTHLGTNFKLFLSLFCVVVFLICIIWGMKLDKQAWSKYKDLFMSTGYKTDFTAKYGMGTTLINFGVYGLFILCYYLLIRGIKFDESGVFGFTRANFNGATMGAIFCMFAFVANGAQPRTLLPIMIGYAVASFVPIIAFKCGAVGSLKWSLTTQGYLVGLCFASGLAPVSGKYGVKGGIIAGFMHALLVMTTPLMYNFLNFYNGGFTSGIVAFLLIPVFENFGMKVIEDKE
ncbi:MAG: DUF1576 domain-containing protein [Eubacteriales bacterium]|nr:DUF1576 domain-containing protein [Eubacteriales bacterium]